jgi:isoquinoline 1-oxidoreductase subunit beta
MRDVPENPARDRARRGADGLTMGDADIHRRDFLKMGAGAAGALVLGFRVPVRGQESRGPDPSVFAPNAWLQITPDDRVIVFVEKPELGQGSRTYTPMMIAEELEVEWSAIRVEQAPTVPSIYGHLRTGSSGGVTTMYTSMRRVGAQAREMLLTAAAQRWNVPRTDCYAERSAVVHRPSRRQLR